MVNSNVDDISPFECSDYICPSYMKENSDCDLLCMSPACNYDSSDEKSKDYKARFLSSGCLTNCIESSCSLDNLGDGTCDSSCNTQECGFDLGDCGYCASGCYQNYTDESWDNLLSNNQKDLACNTSICMYDNNQYGWCAVGCFKADLESSTLNPSCNNPSCNYQDLKNSESFCSPSCSPEMEQDAFCQEACNTEACNWDNSTCLCKAGCTETMLLDSTCHEECNNTDCGLQNGVCGDCAPGCFLYMLGDGTCQDSCNVEGCDYDYGDCQCAPGCKSFLNVQTGEWVWESGCNEYCLVEDCLFNYGGCSDGFLIRASFYYGVLQEDLAEVFETSYCTEQYVNCTKDVLRTSDSSKSASDYCKSKACLYSMGQTVSDGNCKRAKESSESECFLCKSSPQILSTCLASKDCPEGLSNYTGLYSIFNHTAVCLKEASYSHKNNYFEINLSPSGTSENIIADAFMKTTRKYVKIKLAAGNYYYGKASETNDIFNIPLSPLTPSITLGIKEIIIEGEKDNRPTIYLSSNIMRIHSKAESLIIRYINFNGSLSLDSNCKTESCTYCPYYSKVYENLYINDRSSLIDISQYSSGCDSFSSSKFITVESGSSLQLEEVGVYNFQQQYSSFIYSEGKVSLVNVDFNKVQSASSGFFIYVYGEDSSFTYVNGKVSGVNYGYEYRNDIEQSGFFYADSSDSVEFEDIEFDSNFVLVGSDQSVSSYFIKFSDVTGTVAFLGCNFTRSVAYGLIYFDSSAVSYSSYSIDKYGNIDKYSQFHLAVKNSYFNDVGSFECILCVKMSNIVQNILITGCTFKEIFNAEKGIINIQNDGTYSSLETEGAWSYVNDELGYIQSRKIEITDTSFQEIYYSGNLIEITENPKILIQNVSFSNCMQSEIKNFTQEILIKSLAGN